MQTAKIAASGLGLAALLLLAGVTAAQAQSYTLNALASFSGGGGSPNGGLTLSADGSTLYGTTQGGLVYSLPTSGGTLTSLADVSGTAFAGLTLSADGRTLYGTSSSGGADSEGLVFSVPTSGGAASVLTSFNGTDGSSPGSLLLSADGSTLYGTTQAGGTDHFGTVFSLPVSGGPLTTLTSFGGTDGETPGLSLTRIGSTLYGTTESGSVFGTNNEGEIFSLSTSGGTPTVLSTFNGSNGSLPSGLTLSADGRTFYGTANGNVFSAPVAGGAPTILSGSTFGPSLNGDLTLVGSTLYGTGTTGVGRGDSGGVLSLSVSGGTPTVLAAFNGFDGDSPAGGLTLGANGTFYGATQFGGAGGQGTVFSLTPNAAPVPEASSVVSFGLLLLGGLGGVLRTRRRKSQG